MRGAPPPRLPTVPAEVAVADLRSPQTLAVALDGGDGVFYIGPAFAPDDAGVPARARHEYAHRSVSHPPPRLTGAASLTDQCALQGHLMLAG